MMDQQQNQLAVSEAFQYLVELINAYMQTLPRPVRKPCIQAVNACAQQVTNALQEGGAAIEQMRRLREEEARVGGQDAK